MHENAGNLGNRAWSIANMVTRYDANVLAMTYRGYDPSEGTPSEWGLKMDCDAINLLLNDTANSKHPEIESYID